MARLIVWTLDRDLFADPEAHNRFQRGMVVDVLEDGQDPGNAFWNQDPVYLGIIDIVGLSKEGAAFLAGPMHPSVDVNKRALKRANAVNLNAVTFDADNCASISLLDAFPNRVILDHADDPNALGSDPKVIG